MKGPNALKALNSELDTSFILFTASQSTALEYEKSLTTKPAKNDDDFGRFNSFEKLAEIWFGFFLKCKGFVNSDIKI